jgi:hypothetical protein
MVWSTLTAALYDLKRLEFEVGLLSKREQNEDIAVEISETLDEVSDCITPIERTVKILQTKIKGLNGK